MAKVQRWRASQPGGRCGPRTCATAPPTARPSPPPPLHPGPLLPLRPPPRLRGRHWRASSWRLESPRSTSPCRRTAVARSATRSPAPASERPPPAESRKKTRGTGALQAALAAAAPPAAAPQPLTASSALWFDSIDGSMRQFDAGVPRPCRRHTTSRKAKPG
jgi:hypothetical protein